MTNVHDKEKWGKKMSEKWNNLINSMSTSDHDLKIIIFMNTKTKDLYGGLGGTSDEPIFFLICMRDQKNKQTKKCNIN